MERSALQVALKWLEKADRSAFELQNYLLKKGFTEQETEETVLQVQNYGYMNDRSLTDRVTDTLRSNLQGELKIQQKLSQRGLQSTTPVEDASDRAYRLLVKKFASHESTTDPKIIAKSARFLAAQGYQQEEVEAALTRFFVNSEL